MKITDVEVVVVRQDNVKMIGDGSQDTAVVLVHTDEGITGIGEVDSSPEVVKAIVETRCCPSISFSILEGTACISTGYI